jgi:hypothetical protein
VRLKLARLEDARFRPRCSWRRARHFEQSKGHAIAPPATMVSRLQHYNDAPPTFRPRARGPVRCRYLLTSARTARNIARTSRRDSIVALL